MHDLAYTALDGRQVRQHRHLLGVAIQSAALLHGRIAHSVPIFMLLGNHEGERGDRADMAEWSLGMRWEHSYALRARG